MMLLKTLLAIALAWGCLPVSLAPSRIPIRFPAASRAARASDENTPI